MRLQNYQLKKTDRQGKVYPICITFSLTHTYAHSTHACKCIHTYIYVIDAEDNAVLFFLKKSQNEVFLKILQSKALISEVNHNFFEGQVGLKDLLSVCCFM